MSFIHFKSVSWGYLEVCFPYGRKTCHFTIHLDYAGKVDRVCISASVVIMYLICSLTMSYVDIYLYEAYEWML